jgi:hypothetical protein
MVDNCRECDQEAFDKTFENHKPYINLQEDEDGNIIRKFPADTEAHLLKWHSDESDRYVISLCDSDWQFQFDNELPIKLKANHPIHIDKDRIHRLIKGSGDLILHIKEF